MAYLDNTSVVVDAILTKKGRELLARNDGSFKITQFSLADDEIDYSLYNPYHPSGSAFYGEAIQSMPVIQAYPEDVEIMKYKLMTLPRGTAVLPVIGNPGSYNNVKLGQSISVSPTTINYLGSNTSQQEASGYTFTIDDSRLFSNFTATGINTPAATSLNNSVTLGTNVSQTVIGTTLSMTVTTSTALFTSGATTITTRLTIIGRDTGARITIPITISKI
jgi:hypothetical protein